MGCAPIHYLVPHRDWVGDAAGHCPETGFSPARREMRPTGAAPRRIDHQPPTGEGAAASQRSVRPDIDASSVATHWEIS